MCRWDVIADKGTLDAIGLMEGAQEARAAYKQAVLRLLRPKGLLVITSCNSTKDELVAELTGPKACPPGARLEYVDHVRTHPVFKFGGTEGTRVCTVAFRKVNS